MTERDLNQIEEDLFRADTILDDCLRAREPASSNSCTEPASTQAREAELDAASSQAREAELDVAIRSTIENNTRYAKRKHQEAAETEAKHGRHGSSSDSCSIGMLKRLTARHASISADASEVLTL